VIPRYSFSNPMNSLNQQYECLAYRFNRAASVFRDRRVVQGLCGRLATAIFVAVAVGAPGCSIQQNQTMLERQSKDLSAVGSLDDYLAQGSNDYPFMYASYGSCDPFMIDPFFRSGLRPVGILSRSTTSTTEGIGIIHR
jgi:hypothetical protein